MTTRASLRLALLLASIAACGGGHKNNPDAFVPLDGPPDSPPVVDGAPDAIPTDASMSFGLVSIFPTAASRTVDTTLTITGYGINGSPAIHLSNCDVANTTYDLTASATTSTSITTTLAADPTRVQGAYTVTVTNGDGMTASLMCALHIVAEPPPTVTSVTPTTAWQGVANDGIDSDTTVTITGTGFLSTPSVRWVSTTDPNVHYDAIYVGFETSTQITAIVPSETQMMPAGTYNVYVTNPDLLSAEWLSGATPGVFTVTATPPPSITSVTPQRILQGSCTSTELTIAGANFSTSPAATVWYLVPAGTTCTGSTTDANGNTLCPMTVDTSMAAQITAHFSTCPALGPYPLVVVNGDGQTAYFYDIEITPSSSGHLNTGSFTTAQNGLETARWKHAVQYGFDVFGHSYVWVAGGQDASRNVLGSVEASQFDLFGTPGPFAHVEQYFGTSMPRAANDLGTPREGLTLLRAGKSLFAIGGATMPTDTTANVPASSLVERAEILSYDQMPGVMQPTALGGTGLPTGSWYYRVSAVGPWGESLSTHEVVAINKSGQIQVCWVAPTGGGATGYNIYRSLASDGRAGTSAAIAYEVTSATNCWTDSGTGQYAPAPGNLRGTLAAGGAFAAGTYSYRVSAVVPLTGGSTWETYAGYATQTTITSTDVTNTMQTIHLAWDAVPITGVTYRVYRLDPVSGNYELLTGASALATTSFDDTDVAFDAGGATPKTEVYPLPPGSLSKWTTTNVPALNTAREGLDGVVIAMDPTTSNHVAYRLLVAGGRDASPNGNYLKTAESLAVYDDGHVDAAWTNETPQFNSPRAYYALLTTQDQNSTPFPPPPEQPPCGNNCGTVVNGPRARNPIDAVMAAYTSGTRAIENVVGTDPVYVVAVLGADAYATTGPNANKLDALSSFETCAVDMTTGLLEADCGVTGSTTWILQSNGVPAGNASYGMDAVLYFSFLYPFYGVSNHGETLSATGSTINLIASAISRFPVDITVMTGQIIGAFQSASTSFVVQRAYYQMTRLLAYVYVIGGWQTSTTPAGPTGSVEQHQQ